MPDDTTSSSRTAGDLLSAFLANTLLLVAGTVSGAALGGLFVKWFVPRASMGWDGLADALGGLMLGALIGLVASIALIWKLTLRRRFQVVAIEIAFILLVVVGVRLTRDPPAVSKPVVREESFKPVYRVRMNVGHTEEILRAVQPGQEPIPFTLAKLWTAIPQLEYTGWGPDFTYCRVEPSREDLSLLVPLVTAAAEEARAGSCLTPQTDDLGVNLNITLGGERMGSAVQEGCFPQRPQLLTLAEALGELGERLCSSKVLGPTQSDPP